MALLRLESLGDPRFTDSWGAWKEIHPDEDLKERLESRAQNAKAAERHAQEQLEVARQRIASASEQLAMTQQNVAAKQNTLSGLVDTLHRLLGSDNSLKKELDKAACAFRTRSHRR